MTTRTRGPVRALWDAMQEKEKLFAEEMTDAAGLRLAELECVVAEEDGVRALQAVHAAFGLGGAALHRAEGTESPLETGAG